MMNIITATAILMASINGISANEQKVINQTMDGNLVTAKEVFLKQSDGVTLLPDHRCVYAYDDAERLVRKEVLRWNEDTKEWQNSHCWSYTYTAEGYTVEYAEWNRKQAAYTNSMKKQEVNEHLDGTLIVSQYVRKHATDDWTLKESYLMLRPDDILLASTLLGE